MSKGVVVVLKRRQLSLNGNSPLLCDSVQLMAEKGVLFFFYLDLFTEIGFLADLGCTLLCEESASFAELV